MDFRASEVTTKANAEAVCDLSLVEGEVYQETALMIKLLLDQIELWESTIIKVI